MDSQVRENASGLRFSASLNKHMNSQTLLRLRCILLLGLILAVSSCALPRRHTSKQPGARYGLVIVSFNRDLMHTLRRYEVHYWDQQGHRTLVWKYLANQLVFTNNLALFHGYLTTGPSDPFGSTRRGEERLFAVDGSGPPADISDEVICLWARANGTNLSYALKRQAIGNITRHHDKLDIHVDLWGGGSGDVNLSWNEIADLIHHAKEDGERVKDPGFGTPYLRRKVESD